MTKIKQKFPFTQACELLGEAGKRPVTGCWWAMISLCTILWYWSKRTPELLRLRIFLCVFLNLFCDHQLGRAGNLVYCLTDDEANIQMNCCTIKITFSLYNQFKAYFSNNIPTKVVNQSQSMWLYSSFLCSRINSYTLIIMRKKYVTFWCTN